MNKNNILKWIGNIIIMFSAIIVGFFPTISLHWQSFLGYIIGAGIWTWLALKAKDSPLAFLNIFYVLIDVYAIYIRV